MLDSETRRRIDTARDILVGKVPDPKTQVEQITFALIYKFMDDMDQQSVSLGGKATFFANGYEQYAWSKLMDRKLGGAARLDLYVRALEGMSTNPHIPQLFRDIFKGAFMPYRDAETLNLFLKEMNGFTYAHSEDLGDAYEYLLSIFASQGKAGQFRTPRHIIDFIVDCVNPGKNDTVLDPACGTAGFLISAYKHIIDQNSATPLTGEEKKRLTGNFAGYDISPDMVRLSRVNMYLHQFPNPTIYEYDTLTYEDRWDETYDVILANPPFMTPKGGIRPHTRFAVKANRSEVLFVDYIAEHLNPGGRAGVIVPEGIIFQSANAYKALRKMLVDGNYLVAVISLPAGIFQPYSGVKTSVLLLDKDLAKCTDKVLFVNVKADGYDLGAQRREIEHNDLPEALRLVKAFQEDPVVESGNPLIAQAVSKQRLGEDGEWNLSGERYRETKAVNQKWPMVKLGEVITLEYGKPLKEEDRKNGEFPVFGSNGIVGYHNEFLVEGPFIIVGRKGSAGKVVFSEKSGYPIDTTFYVKILDPEILNLKFIYQILRSIDLGAINTQSGVPGLNRNDAYNELIPLPPLEVQQAIVDEIERYQKIIDGARQVVENYKPVIKIDPSWPLVKLGEVCVIERGASPRPINDFITDDPKGLNWIKIGDAEVGGKYITQTKQKITSEGAAKSRYVKPGDFVLSNSMSFGRPYIMAIDGYIHDGWLHLRDFSPSLDKDYLYNVLSSNVVIEQFKRAATGGVVNNLNSELVRNVSIPLPEIHVQQTINQEMQTELNIIDSSKLLISIFEKKIMDIIHAVWNVV